MLGIYPGGVHGDVLIVDDDEIVLGLIAATLAVAGVDSRTAADGDEALAAIAASLPDCVILDVTMPGRSGLDLCAMLRTDGRTESIPVILLTGRGQLGDKAIGFDSGADDYIVKPFDPDELTRRVIDLLSPVRQRRWQRQDDAGAVKLPIRPTLALGGGPVRW